MDIQHITNPKYSKIFFKDYATFNGLSITIESREHFLLTKYKDMEFSSAEELIEKELESLKEFTNVPSDIIDSILIKINNRYKM